MDAGQGVGGCCGEREEVPGREFAVVAYVLVKGVARYVRGGEPRAFGFGVCIDQRDEVGAGDLAQGGGLTCEPLSVIAVPGVILVKDLDREGLAAVPVVRVVDGSHATRADALQRSVGAYPVGE